MAAIDLTLKRAGTPITQPPSDEPGTEKKPDEPGTPEGPDEPGTPGTPDEPGTPGDCEKTCVPPFTTFTPNNPKYQDMMTVGDGTLIDVPFDQGSNIAGYLGTADPAIAKNFTVCDEENNVVTGYSVAGDKPSKTGITGPLDNFKVGKDSTGKFWNVRCHCNAKGVGTVTVQLGKGKRGAPPPETFTINCK